ncbi:MAG: ABC transporter permease subunit [Chitinivibrionales bacterium]|nr:ABC transporter permease subunit [Chitinivibrionales bacterium]MBD3358676.1 ABC transporter permease subunit [Chitinivibrionales bacterium]
MTEERTERILLIGGTAAISIGFLGPVLYMIAVGFSRSPDLLGGDMARMLTLSNFVNVVTGKNLHFLAYLRNSLIVSALSACICVAVAGMAAYAITRIRFRGSLTVMIVVLAVSMFPQISLVGYLFRLISGLGWINTHQGLVFPYAAWILPLSLWILVSYFAQIPRGLDIAARIDGCNHWQILTRIIVPVAAPGLFSTALLAFIFGFNEFMFALMLTTDYHARTVPVGIALFQGLHGQIPWGTIMAASVVTTAPVVVLTLIFQRYIVQGLTRGAVKG